MRTQKPATQISILINPGAASTKDPPLFSFLLPLPLTRNINVKRQEDKDLALSALAVQMGWFTPSPR